MQSVHVLENIIFCSLFTNHLRPFRDFNHHTVTRIIHPSSSHRRHEMQLYSLSLLVFRACNYFCTVLSRTVLNTYTLQTRKRDDGRPSDSSTWAATKRASHALLTLAMWNSRNRQLNHCHSGKRSRGCLNQDGRISTRDLVPSLIYTVGQKSI